MARIRSIHPGLWTDENFVSLPDAAALLYLGLLGEADDNGIFEWKPLTIKMRLRAATTELPSDIESHLHALSEARMLIAFDVDGRRFGAIRNFAKWQRPKSPKGMWPLPADILKWVGLNGSGERPNAGTGRPRAPDEQDEVPNDFGTSSEQKPLMEEGGGRMEKEETSSLRSDVRPPGPETEMLDAYNEAARQVGWPTAEKLTQPRKTSLGRIAADIGAEGWRNAMARARASPFLTGKAGRRDGHENWRPDLDFFLRPKTLTKLMEGSYDGAPGGSRQATDRPHDTVLRALASVVKKRSRDGGGQANPHGRPDDDGGGEEADILLPPSHSRPTFTAAR